MKENLTIGLLVVIAIASIANTVMLMGNDGVSYEQTPVNNSMVSNAAASQNMQNADMMNNQQTNPAIVQEPAGPTTQVQFAAMAHDFGTVEQNTHNTKVFTFTNTGEHPLIITDAKGSCGCTVPNYPREPVQPGETGEIEVVYNPGEQINQQTKTVTITANTEPATTVLQIKANVVPAS